MLRLAEREEVVDEIPGWGDGVREVMAALKIITAPGCDGDTFGGFGEGQPNTEQCALPIRSSEETKGSRATACGRGD